MNLTRRTVLKSIAAAMMAPTIRLRNEIDREALMRPFCGDDFRHSLSEPFQQGSLTYCTDARRIIRAELTAPEIVGERRLPNAVRLWNQNWRSGQFMPIKHPAINDLLPSSEPDIPGTCPKCFERRVCLGAEYPPCDDDGMVSMRLQRLGWDVDDNTVRDASCPLCHGLEYYGPSQMEIGRLRYSYALIAPVFALPGVVFLPAEATGQPLLFRAEGFEGMAMPLQQRRGLS